MELKVERITPEIAMNYLKLNVDNYRKISKYTVTKYAKDMAEGRWQLNGESIVFGADGKLKNGQHRLAAVIQAGKPVDMTVVRGVDDSVNIFDSGANRSLTQIANATVSCEVGNTEAAVANAIVGVFSVPTKAESVEWISTHYKELRRAYKASGAGIAGSISNRMPCVLAAYLMLEAENMRNYEVEVFFRVFNSGDTIGTDGYEVSGAMVARQMYLERFPKGKFTRSTYKDQTEIVVKALRDFREGKVRQNAYQIREPLECLELLSKVRKADGLE